MPITIDWNNRIVEIPKDYTFLLQTNPSEIRQLDMQVLKDDIKAIEASEEGMSYVDIHDYVGGITVSGAVLAPVVQFINGFTCTFEDGQYRVNCVGANTNIGEVTNVNQVSVSTSNSAGLQDLNSLQAASYGGKIAVNPNSAYADTVFPAGTRAYPVNNLADALTIAEERGINIINIVSSMTFSSGDFSQGYIFEGDSPVVVTVTLDPGVDVSNCEFQNMTVTGTLDGNNTFNRCHINNVNFFNGAINNCALEGTITLGGGLQADFVDCYSGIAGGGPGQFASVNMGGAGQSLSLRNYNGGIEITNSTGVGQSSLDFNSGRAVFDSSCTGGEFWVRGICHVDDSSVGALVYDQTETRMSKMSAAYDAYRQEVVDQGGYVELVTYDEDGVSVLYRNVIKNPSGGKPTVPADSATQREAQS